DTPAGGGGSGMSTTERQQFSLSLIYQSKLFGGCRRAVKLSADGYMDGSCIDSLTGGSRTSTSAASSYVAPTPSSSTAATVTNDVNEAALNNLTIRQVIAAAQITATGAGGVTVTFEAGSVEGYNITNAYICEGSTGGDAYDCTASP